MIGKLAEPPPPKGVSVEEWDKRLQKGPGKLKKSEYDDSMFSGDPTKLMPRLRQIHKFAAQPTDDRENTNPKRQVRQTRGLQKESFGLGDLYPNAGEPVYDAPQLWRPKTKRAGALLPARNKDGFKLQGHTEFQGLPIAIENRRGSIRSGTDGDGHSWRVKMKHPYGYLKGTQGADGDEIDVYVGPDKNAPKAFVVRQLDKETRKYDEDKVMLGLKNKTEAKEVFLDHHDCPQCLGPVAEVSMERLKELVKEKGPITKIAMVSYAALLDELYMLGKAGE